MRVTLSWLKAHLDTAASTDRIAETLTMIGLEVESVTDRAAGLRDFVVARVVEARRHPNADKLSVCTVETGSGRFEVVCGAPNVRTGMKGVFAASGSFVPGAGITLKRASIRGVESCGMLLSEREMGLSDEHTGIVELAADAPVGAPAVAVMGLDDPVIDVAITPNRGDCLGVRGIARELAAAGLGTLKPLAADPLPGAFESPIGVRMDLDGATADACPYFVGRYIRGVRNRESPTWLKEKLLAVGLRPISALVDITNYITLDLCRPLHAFDADKVRGDLRVRMARPDEMLSALNGRTYALDGEMTVIADDAGPEALGGVMGGEGSACTADTVNVFLESALFDPLRTASTGRRLGLTSDARYRFERGIDPSFVATGMEIATRLVVDLCGGEPSFPVVAGREPSWRRDIAFRPGRVRALCGVDIDHAQVADVLGILGFTGEFGGGTWRVTVPPWRNDIVGEACLVEEVVRIHGYDRIPTVPLPRTTERPQAALTPEQRRRATARRTLAARGLVEAVTFSFLSSAAADLFGGVADELRLVNPISADLDVMRPSLLPNLIAAAGRNADRGIADASLFEVGPQYAGCEPDGQELVAAGIRSGRTGPRNWAEPPRPVDAFDAKADALAVLEAVGVPTDPLHTGSEAPAWYHPGRSGTLSLGPKTVLAVFGEIHPRVLRRMQIRGPVVGFEVLLDLLPRAAPRRGAARPPLRLAPFQPIERDFAFVVDVDVPAEALVGAARKAARALVTDVRVFDVFVGGGLGAGKKSLALGVVLQPTERTLTDPEIADVAARIVASVEAATGATLRA
ncbi:MAG: phenylalanine--tRNA ligase subunit beta [Rhodospirillales bacterium]